MFINQILTKLKSLVYSKSETDSLLGGKANSSHTHTKSQITDFPTIPTVNNATLTIQKNGTNVATFTSNASSNVTANISVPTNTNQLTNGSGFITSEIDSQSLGTSGWIKFKNGLQICWENGIQRSSLGTRYSWNKAFKSVFVAIASDVGPDNGSAVAHGSEAVCIRILSATQYRIGDPLATLIKLLSGFNILP